MNKIVLNEDLLKRAASVYQENYFKKTHFNEEEYQTTEAFEKRINKIIKSEKSLYHRVTLTTMRKVICIIIAILIMLLSSLSVSAVREAIANLFIQTFATHNVINPDLTKDKEYPTKIEKVYVLSKIPEGYEVVDESIDVELSTSFYYVKDGMPLVLQQSVKSEFMTYYDNEQSEYVEEEYNNQKYLVKSSSDNSYDIIWDDGEYVFDLYGYLPKKTMFELINSLTVKEL